MAQIHILDEQTIDQIAAGEVIERPVSVVTELVENALDAGADRISVEIAGGGIDLIRVTDNGCGIPADQVRIAFFRHATSKIDTAEDLYALHSLGFRGEALSSIASVARVEVLTRTPDSVSGCRYVIEGGTEMLLDDAGAPAGTAFTVRDLFFNTPVRRKFLRSPQTETSYIVTLMEQLSLSRPGVAMRLVTDGKLRLQTNGSYSLKDIIYMLYGRETAAHLRPVFREIPGLKAEGYAGEPMINRANRSGELFFVNGRFVKSPLLMKAVEQAYHGLTMQHKFPVAILQLTMDASLVDVNVHPNKTEVRFRSEREIFDLVCHGVRDALYSQDLIPPAEEEPEVKPSPAAAPDPAVCSSSAVRRQEATAEIRNEPSFSRESVLPPADREPETAFPAAPQIREQTDYRIDADRRLLERILDRSGQTAPAVPVQQDLFEEKIIQPGKEASFRLIGQVFATYWLIEYENWFLLADQHAVHEKILYERTMRSLKTREATSQQLLPPMVLSLNGAQQETLERCAASFAALGFEVAPMGGREYRVDAVPDNLFSLSARELFLQMLDELSEERVTAPAMIDEKVALMSCKAAVKGNDVLAHEEAEALLKELLALENPYTCPHGRPTMIRMSRSELEKKFRRVL